MVTPSLSCYPHSVSLPPMFLSSLVPRPRILLPTCDTESQSMLRLVLGLGPRLVSFLPVLLYALASVVTSTATFFVGSIAVVLYCTALIHGIPRPQEVCTTSLKGIYIPQQNTGHQDVTMGMKLDNHLKHQCSYPDYTKGSTLSNIGLVD